MTEQNAILELVTLAESDIFLELSPSLSSLKSVVLHSLQLETLGPINHYKFIIGSDNLVSLPTQGGGGIKIKYFYTKRSSEFLVCTESMVSRKQKKFSSNRKQKKPFVFHFKGIAYFSKMKL